MSKRGASGWSRLRGFASWQHSSEETSQRWRAVGDTVSDLNDSGIRDAPELVFEVPTRTGILL